LAGRNRGVDLASILGTEFPLIQAPMAGVQDSRLAIAVCEAGGLGSLPAALLEAQALRRELAAMCGRTGRAFNVNFFCHARPRGDRQRELLWEQLLAPYFAEFGVERQQAPAPPARLPFDEPTAELLAQFKPAVVSFHFGLPTAALLQKVRAWGARVLSSATTVAEARWLEAQGVDAIIAQGSEAGGHRGMFLTDDLSSQLPTLELVPQICRAVRVPVLAAGGIADAAGVAAALRLGAAGVQVGSAYLLCPEATTSAVHRAALRGEAGAVTAVTNLFTGRPARGIVNRLMRELGPMNSSVPDFPLAANALAPLRLHTERLGSGDFSPLWVGENIRGCRERPAAEVTRELLRAFADT
jgi:nitronate monooxygenase